MESVRLVALFAVENCLLRSRKEKRKVNGMRASFLRLNVVGKKLTPSWGTPLSIPSDILSTEAALAKFTQTVQQIIPRASMTNIEKPKSEVIGKLPEFGRTISIMNRRMRSGRKRETVLTILNGKRPVLVLSRNEVDELEKNLPKIKSYFKEFAKQL